MAKVRKIPVILDGPYAGQPVPATWPIAVQTSAGIDLPYHRWRMGVGLERTRYTVQFVARADLDISEAMALAFDWLVEHAFASEAACSCPVGWGALVDANCPRHGRRDPEHTITGAPA
jgi:hypothetical protein